MSSRTQGKTLFYSFKNMHALAEAYINSQQKKSEVKLPVSLIASAYNPLYY